MARLYNEWSDIELICAEANVYSGLLLRKEYLRGQVKSVI